MRRRLRQHYHDYQGQHGWLSKGETFPLHLRQEINGAQAEQLEPVPCGQMLHDEDDGRSEEELSPAQMKDRDIRGFSFLKSVSSPKLHMHRKILQRSEKGGGSRP